MKTLKFLLFIALVLSQIQLKAQHDFTVSFSSRNDSIQYYIHNHTKDTINAVSVNANWFHMSDYLVFWPEDLSVGLNIETVEGKYTGSNYIFKYQSIQSMSFDFDILPGDSQRFATAVNYRDIEDTVMVGNIQIWYSTATQTGLNSVVYASNTSNCEFAEYYLVANKGNDGIKKSTKTGPTLHPSPNCLNGLFVVVVDRNTLKPKPVMGVYPECEDGRKWTSFGYPTDDFVFYYFDPLDTAFETKLIQLIKNVQSGDHIFMSTQGTNLEYDMRTDALRNAFIDLGAKTGQSQTGLDVGEVFCAFGSKGNQEGTFFAFTKNKFNTSDYVEKRIFLLPSQYPDINTPFAPCYEATISEIKREQPKEENHIIHPGILSWKYYPNPLKQNKAILNVVSDKALLNQPVNIRILSVTGKTILKSIEHKTHHKINLSHLSAGLYYLFLNGEMHKLIIN